MATLAPAMVLFRSLGSRSFALLWLGQIFSRLGDHMYQLALAWWVLEKTGSATVMGTVLIFAFAPMVVFSLVGGVAVDRFQRVRVMLLSDLCRGAVVGLVAVLAFGNGLEVWHVYLASLVFGFINAFFQPAYVALVPELVPAENLPSANALSSMSQQLGRIIGPVLGAAIVSLGGTPATFAVIGLSFFIAAAFLVPLLPLSLSRPHGSPSSVIYDLREGISVVLGAPWLWITILVSAIANIALAGPYLIALPFLVRDELQAGISTLGLLYAMFPLGYAVSAVWLGRLTKLRRRGLAAYAGLITAGLMMLMLGLPLPLIALALAAFINGMALEVFGLVWLNMLQELVPGEKLGRVSSIDSLGSFALLPLGYALAGWATEHFGAALVCVLGGALAASFAAMGLSLRAIRSVD